jgi:hypothetical protein
MGKRGTVLGRLSAQWPKVPWPAHASRWAERAPCAGAAAWPVEALRWLPFGEVDGLGTGDERGTHRAESGVVGLTKTACPRQGGGGWWHNVVQWQRHRHSVVSVAPRRSCTSRKVNGGWAITGFKATACNDSSHRRKGRTAVLQPNSSEDGASSVPMSGQAAQWSESEGGRSDFSPGLRVMG